MYCFCIALYCVVLYYIYIIVYIDWWYPGPHPLWASDQVTLPETLVVGQKSFFATGNILTSDSMKLQAQVSVPWMCVYRYIYISTIMLISWFMYHIKMWLLYSMYICNMWELPFLWLYKLYPKSWMVGKSIQWEFQDPKMKVPYHI